MIEALKGFPDGVAAFADSFDSLMAGLSTALRARAAS